VAQEIPDLNPGDTVTVSIPMKNTGATAWTKTGQFKLGSQGPADNKNWGTDRILLEEGDTIVPGAEKTFTFDVTVPQTDGIINFQWQMVQDGEEWFGSRSELKQIISGNPGSYLDDCDQISGWKSSSGLTLNVTDHKQGNACLEFSGGSTDEFKKVFSPSYNSRGSVASAELRFWYYVSDVTQFESSNQVEIGSSGGPDQNEFNWKLTGLSNGWNFIILKTSEANTMGSPNLHAINWFRIYHRKTGTLTSRLDAVQLIDPTIGPLYTLLVEGGGGGGNYPEGENIAIAALLPPDGMVFDQWTIQSGSPIIQDIYSSTTILTMEEGPAVISATYKSTVSIERKTDRDPDIKLYPNPTSTNYSLTFSVQKESQINLSMMDLSGRQVGTGTYRGIFQPGEVMITLPVTDMLPGSYLLRIQINERHYSKLLMIK